MLAVKGPLRDVVEASREAVTLSELAQASLGGLQAAFGCSLGSFTHSPKNGTIELLGCTDAGALGEYHRHWFLDDPINEPVRSYDLSWLIPATRLPNWKIIARHPLYAEWAPSKDVRYLLHIRLSEARYLQAGAVNIFLCRPKWETDFGRRELLALSHVMPDLETAVRRCNRVAAMSAHRVLLESLLEDGDDRARLALNLDGRIIWASSAAKRVLAASFGREWSLSESLLEKARDVARGLVPSAEFRFAAAGGETTASLNTCRAVTGERFVTVELYSPETRLPAEFRARFRLTAAEAAVLAGLSDGLSNAQIARRRDTSITTVRTHVAHILSKMGVRSRLHAGVLARAAM